MRLSGEKVGEIAVVINRHGNTVSNFHIDQRTKRRTRHLASKGGITPKLSTDGAAAEKKSEGIAPVLIKQHLKSAETNFPIFGMTFSIVCVLAIVRNIETSSTKVTYLVEDDTGQITAHYWLEEGDTIKALDVILNKYATVYGSGFRRGLTGDLPPLPSMSTQYANASQATTRRNIAPPLPQMRNYQPIQLSKVSKEQRGEILLSINDDPEMFQVYHQTSLQGAGNINLLWDELTTNLNSSGSMRRNATEWQDTPLLSSADTWMQQVGCTTATTLEMTQSLVNDFIIFSRKTPEELKQLPLVAPHFAANLMTAVTYMYLNEQRGSLGPMLRSMYFVNGSL
uniref:OB domain-containing protein n=1 Tax=Glossina pallidipes TaxID=7398 RepID=A0A1A9ZW82_GLOPL